MPANPLHRAHNIRDIMRARPQARQVFHDQHTPRRHSADGLLQPRSAKAMLIDKTTIREDRFTPGFS